MKYIFFVILHDSEVSVIKDISCFALNMTNYVIQNLTAFVEDEPLRHSSPKHFVGEESILIHIVDMDSSAKASE